MEKLFTFIQKRLPLLNFRLGWHSGILTFLLNVCFIFQGQAQSIVWDKTYGGHDNDPLKIVRQTDDGGYILGGESNSGISGDKSQASKGDADYWVVKLNAKGTKIWDKTFGGSKYDHLSSLQQTPDGGYILAGKSLSSKSADKSESETGAWVIKLKPDGTKEWDQTIAGNFAYDIRLELTQEGGYILGGTSNSGIGGDKTEASKGGQDYWIIKLKGNGTKDWDKTIGSPGDDNLTALEQTPDGGYMVGGSSQTGEGGDKSEASWQGGFWMVKLKPDGTKQWDKTTRIIYGQYLTELIQTQDSGYLIGGIDRGPFGLYTANYLVIKLDATGKEVWRKTLGGYNEEDLSVLMQTKEGAYIIGGSTDSDASDNKSEPSRGLLDIWLVKLSADGKLIIWDKTIGGNNNDFISSVVQLATGDLIVGATSLSGKGGDKTQPSKGNSDFWLLQLHNPLTNQVKQTITFTPPLYQDFPSQKTVGLTATASSNLPVSFRVVSGPAKVQGNQLTLTGTGTVVVGANQAGNEKYLPAQEATQSIEVINSPVTKLWDKTFGGITTGFNLGSESCGMYTGSSDFSAIVNTPDGGYLLAGTSDSKRGNDKSQTHYGALTKDCYLDYLPISDYWIVKIDANGNKQWDKTIGGNDQDKLVTMVASPDGGYLLAGNSRSGKSHDKSEAAIGLSAYWLVKIDATGNKIWDKTIGNIGYGLSALIATPDGGYLLGDGNFSILKIDAEGRKLWQKKYPGSGFGSRGLRTLLPTSDGGYLLGGDDSSDSSGLGREYSNYFVIKVDAQGNKQWEKIYGGNQDDYLTAIVSTPEGGFLLGGSSYSKASGDKTVPNWGIPYNAGLYPTDYWIVKIDKIGNKLWDQRYGGTEADRLSRIKATPDGNYLLAGISYSTTSGNKSEILRGGEYDTDYWLVKIDASGKMLWDKTFGGKNDDQLVDVLLNPDGTYVIGGTSFSGIGADKSEIAKAGGYWIIKVQEKNAPETTAWDMRYGGSATDNLTTLIKTKDGGYLSGGYTNSGLSGDKSQPGRGKTDYWIVKSDKNGKKLWDKRYGGSVDDFLNRVIQTQDGGYLLAGSSFSGKGGDKSEASKGLRDYWIIKTDAQGNQQWDKTFGGSGNDELQKVIQLATGEYVLGGYSNSPIGCDKSQNSQGKTDYWIVKISKNGTKIWDKRFGGNQEETLSSFVATKDGGFLLGGTSLSGKTGDKTQESQGAGDYWVVKTDNKGRLIWEKTFGGNSTDEAYSIGISSTSNYFIAGTSASGKSRDKSQASKGDKDYWLVTFDQNGNKLWDRTFGGAQEDELRASTYTSQGHYVLAGSSRSGISGDKTQASQGEGDYWVVQVDANGNKVQDQRFGGSGKEELRTITPTHDGGLLLGGRSDSGVSGDRTQPSQGSTDFWLVKVAPETRPRVAARISPEPEAAASDLTTIQAYPNPFREKVTIRFSLPETQAATVRILDNQGRAVITLFQGEVKANQQYELEYQPGKQEAGLYLLQIQTPTGQNTHKILLSK